MWYVGSGIEVDLRSYSAAHVTRYCGSSTLITSQAVLVSDYGHERSDAYIAHHRERARKHANSEYGANSARPGLSQRAGRET